MITIGKLQTQDFFNEEIKKLGPNIINIIIYNNNKGIIIPPIHGLTMLTCSYSDTESIPFIPNLRTLNIINCPNIKKIHNFPNLRILNCNFSKITFIPPMKNLKEIICKCCLELYELTNIPNLTDLQCDNDLKIKFYNKNMRINYKINAITIQHLQGRLYQNTYRLYELLIF